MGLWAYSQYGSLKGALATLPIWPFRGRVPDCCWRVLTAIGITRVVRQDKIDPGRDLDDMVIYVTIEATAISRTQDTHGDQLPFPRRRRSVGTARQGPTEALSRSRFPRRVTTLRSIRARVAGGTRRERRYRSHPIRICRRLVPVGPAGAGAKSCCLKTIPGSVSLSSRSARPADRQRDHS